MIGPYGVQKMHPNSFVENESLTFYWKDGLLSVTYVRHDSPDQEKPSYLAEWQVKCEEPKKVREQQP